MLTIDLYLIEPFDLMPSLLSKHFINIVHFHTVWTAGETFLWWLCWVFWWLCNPYTKSWLKQLDEWPSHFQEWGITKYRVIPVGYRRILKDYTGLCGIAFCVVWQSLLIWAFLQLIVHLVTHFAHVSDIAPSLVHWIKSAGIQAHSWRLTYFINFHNNICGLLLNRATLSIVTEVLSTLEGIPSFRKEVNINTTLTYQSWIPFWGNSRIPE